RVRVARVLDPFEPGVARVRVDGAARQRDQRPVPGDARTVDACRGHCREPRGAGATAELQEERLRLVVLVVRERDDARAVLLRERAQSVVAGVARLRLEARARRARDDDAALGVRKAALRTGARAERAP